MFKKILLSLLSSAVLINLAYADHITESSLKLKSSGYSQAKQGQDINTQPEYYAPNVTADSAQSNSPMVNSRAASSQLFPEQNQITGQKGKKYNTTPPVDQNSSEKSTYTKNTAANANQANSPTVNSRLYSGAQFPSQNHATGTKHQKYYTKEQRKTQINNPNVNSRLYSGAQFPGQNQFNDDGKNN